jgi:hypothetical protein
VANYPLPLIEKKKKNGLSQPLRKRKKIKIRKEKKERRDYFT